MHFMVIVVVPTKIYESEPDVVGEYIYGVMNQYCEDNGGTEYDWYLIGGRYSGIINDAYDGSNQYNDDISSQLKPNSMKISDLITKIKPDSGKHIYRYIVDQNGKYYSYEEPISFGCNSNYADDIDKDWRKIYEKILNDNINDYVVALDCHI